MRVANNVAREVVEGAGYDPGLTYGASTLHTAFVRSSHCGVCVACGTGTCSSIEHHQPWVCF
jgi:hypothetical protein